MLAEQRERERIMAEQRERERERMAMEMRERVLQVNRGREEMIKYEKFFRFFMFRVKALEKVNNYDVYV